MGRSTVTHHKSKAVLDHDVPQPTVGTEKPIEVSLPDAVTQTPNIDACAHHGCLGGRGRGREC